MAHRLQNQIIYISLKDTYYTNWCISCFQRKGINILLGVKKNEVSIYSKVFTEADVHAIFK